MAKFSIVAVYDRKKVAEKKGVAPIDIRITLSRTERKFIKYGECSPKEWQNISKSEKLKCEIERLEEIVRSMIVLNEEMTIEVLNSHLGTTSTTTERVRLSSNFIKWMRDQLKSQNLKPNTVRSRTVAIDALESSGKVKRFADLTTENLYAFDEWLRQNGEDKSDVTLYSYHKRIHPYVTLAYKLGILDEDPYKRCDFKHGKSKVRKPLLEDELLKLRNLELPLKLDKVRDLFIFAAYTGLAYADVMVFNYHTMTEQHNNQTYIDGERVKSGGNFFTPILPPAMEVLKKYDFKLPQISNQKVNDYLHVLETRAELNKPLTFHIARHSFATLALTYDIPIDKLQRMMGHENIRTTQIYGKVFKNVLMNHAEGFSNAVK